MFIFCNACNQRLCRDSNGNIRVITVWNGCNCGCQSNVSNAQNSGCAGGCFGYCARTNSATDTSSTSTNAPCWAANQCCVRYSGCGYNN